MNLLDSLKALGVRVTPMLFKPGEQILNINVKPEELVAVYGADLVKVRPEGITVDNKQLGMSFGAVIVTPGGRIGTFVLSMMSRFGGK